MSLFIENINDTNVNLQMLQLTDYGNIQQIFMEIFGRYLGPYSQNLSKYFYIEFYILLELTSEELREAL